MLGLGNPPTYFDVTTTVGYSGTITICVNYAGVSYVDPAQLRLYHDGNGTWVDVTTSLDTPTQVICGTTSSLSPLAVAQPAWPFAGFFSPVANTPTTNVVEAGSAVPVRFSLGGTRSTWSSKCGQLDLWLRGQQLSRGLLHLPLKPA